MVTDEGLLYMEPQQSASEEPVLDEVTQKMTAAFRLAEPSEYGYRGFHQCICGACGTNYDYQLRNGEWTNSLCVHYLAYHREEVPQSQLDKVKMLEDGSELPSDNQMRGLDPFLRQKLQARGDLLPRKKRKRNKP